MSDYTLSADHSATMKTSNGITLNTNQSFVPYDINIVPASTFKISEGIKTVVYTGRVMNTFSITKDAEVKTIGNSGTVDNIVNIGTISDILNRGTITTLTNDKTNGNGTIGTISNGTISNIIGTTTITNVSGSIVIPSKSNLTGSIVFGGDNGTYDVTLKYDSDKGCMVFSYE